MGCLLTVTDSGFPEGGSNLKDGGGNLLFWPIFPENCIKIKIVWTRGSGYASPQHREYESLFHLEFACQKITNEIDITHREKRSQKSVAHDTRILLT